VGVALHDRTIHHYKEATMPSYIAAEAITRLNHDIHEAAKNLDISPQDADRFITYWNIGRIDSSARLEHIPDRVEVEVHGQMVVEYRTTVEVPFVHCDEDIDDAVRVAWENTLESELNGHPFIEVNDMRIVTAHEEW
jgi:hypothetical protein